VLLLVEFVLKPGSRVELVPVLLLVEFVLKSLIVTMELAQPCYSASTQTQLIVTLELAQPCVCVKAQ
jgi:hypothetical protein